MICKVNELAENTLEIVLPNGTDNAFKNVRRISVRKSGSNLAKFFPEEAFGAEAWTSVKDKLPEYGEYVLVFTEGCIAIGCLGEDRFGKNKWKSDGVDEWGDIEILKDVTHWMPLPNEPKDNA